MKKILTIMLAITMILTFTACSGKSGDSPTLVVENYFAAFAEGDLDKAAQFTNNPEKNSSEIIFTGMESDYKEIILAVFKTLECTVTEEAIDGKSATVTATISRVDANKILAESGAEVMNQYLNDETGVEEHESNFVTSVKDALNKSGAPVVVDSINVRLVESEDGQWKIDVGEEMSSLFSFKF